MDGIALRYSSIDGTRLCFLVPLVLSVCETNEHEPIALEAATVNMVMMGPSLMR